MVCKCLIRFANLLSETKLSKEEVWKILNFERKSFLSEQHNECKNQLLSNEKVNNNIENLSKELNVTSTTNVNVSKTTLQTAAEMFFYLNYCPDKLLLLIQHVLKNESPKDIILAFTNLLKHPRKIIREATMTIFQKVIESFKLFHHEKIQIISKGKCFLNGTFENCLHKRNFSEEDIQDLGLYFCLKGNSKIRFFGQGGICNSAPNEPIDLKFCIWSFKRYI